MSGLLRTVWRLISLLWHLAQGLVQVITLQYRHGKLWHQENNGKNVVSCWLKRLNEILGLQVKVIQPPLPVPAMIVANHVSWLDVVAIGSVRPAQFLAKDDVRHWPIIGTLAKFCGTQFIRRNSVSTLRKSSKALCHALRTRQHVVVFPEGTTTKGDGVGAFHSALFSAANQAYCPVQPLAIRYRCSRGQDDVAPYVGNDIFIVHLWKILRRKETRVELQFLPPISSRDHRRELASRSREMICAALEKETQKNPPLPVLKPLLHCFSMTK